MAFSFGGQDNSTRFLGSNFWGAFGKLQSSQSIEELLAKDDCDMSMLLNDDDMIQECKHLNQNLLDFITKDRVKEMLEYITVMPEDDQHQRGHKFPFVVAEIFNAEIMHIIDQFFITKGEYVDSVRKAKLEKLEQTKEETKDEYNPDDEYNPNEEYLEEDGSQEGEEQEDQETQDNSNSQDDNQEVSKSIESNDENNEDKQIPEQENNNNSEEVKQDTTNTNDKETNEDEIIQQTDEPIENKETLDTLQTSETKDTQETQEKQLEAEQEEPGALEEPEVPEAPEAPEAPEELEEPEEELTEEERGKFDLLDSVFSFLESPDELNPVLCGYFAKLVGVFINRKSKQIFNYIYSNGKVLDGLANHLYSKSLTEILIKLLEVEDSYFEDGVECKVHQERAISIIVGKLGADMKEEDNLNSAQVLADIISSKSEMIWPHVQAIATNVLSENKISMRCSIMTINELCKHNKQESPVVGTLESQLGVFISKALEREKNRINMQYEESINCFGIENIRLLELVREAMKLDSDLIGQVIADSPLFESIMDLYERHPWNNMLHIVLFEIIKDILETGNPYLKTQLLQKANLHKRIILAKEMYSFQSTNELRSGYMAFMTEIANILQKQRSLSTELDEMLTDSEWEEHVVILEERNKVNSTPLGGPNPKEKDITSDDEDDAETGVGFNMHEYFKKFNHFNLNNKENNDEDDIDEDLGDDDDDDELERDEEGSYQMKKALGRFDARKANEAHEAMYVSQNEEENNCKLITIGFKESQEEETEFQDNTFWAESYHYSINDLINEQ